MQDLQDNFKSNIWTRAKKQIGERADLIFSNPEKLTKDEIIVIKRLAAPLFQSLVGDIINKRNKTKRQIKEAKKDIPVLMELTRNTSSSSEVDYRLKIEDIGKYMDKYFDRHKKNKTTERDKAILSLFIFGIRKQTNEGIVTTYPTFEDISKKFPITRARAHQIYSDFLRYCARNN